MMNNLQNRGKNKNRLCGQGSASRDKFNIYYFVVSFVALAILVFPRTSAAYLDPGTGSFVFQMIIAGVVGGLYTIKTYWRNIKAFFKKDNKE
jgi:hypothetical protein